MILGFLLVFVVAISVIIYLIHVTTGKLDVLPRWLVRIWILSFLITVFYTSIVSYHNRLFPFILIKGNGIEVMTWVIQALVGDIKKETVGNILRENIADFCLLLILPVIPSLIIWFMILLIRKYFVK
ncbi:hypothetical protein DNI29_07805 [Hymenobacter sediminis]|uniref:hypothetical protein n=1 Tax=Hymenobacter sediminis TaxID=2218621 RepID=UPI000DA65CB7|nr:hypothetical protein [Hymenobacter sediminis]RPD48512.1 hypothetical protein DNI29_07805 [Hymenobacter sediminis]